MIRAALASDLQAIAAVESACFAEEAWSLEQLDAELSSPTRTVLVEVTAEDVQGYVSVNVVAELSEIMRVAVAPDRQSQGLGRELMLAALERARALGAERMLLEVADTNAAARALYAHLGFVEISRRSGYYRSADALVMQLMIDEGQS